MDFLDKGGLKCNLFLTSCTRKDDTKKYNNFYSILHGKLFSFSAFILFTVYLDMSRYIEKSITTTEHFFRDSQNKFSKADNTSSGEKGEGGVQERE